MGLLGWIIFFSLAGGVGSVLVAALFLLLPEKRQRKIIEDLIAYATGILLAAAFLGLLPHALEKGNKDYICLFLIGGILGFFVLEKVLLWRHCHKEVCQRHSSAAPLILLGDGFHNFLDGIVIAASFLISWPLGVVVSLSVISHEIPQELGDFGILLHSGYSRKKALGFNLLSSLASFIGAVAAYFVLDDLRNFLPLIMALAASSFIYISLSDLTPELHQKTNTKDIFRQTFLIILGVATIILLHRWQALH